MVAGMNTVSALADSEEAIIHSARKVREVMGRFQATCDMQKLDENTGRDWTEISLAQLTGQAITETTELNNPQQYVDTPFSIRPTMVGIQIRTTDEVMRRISKKTIAQLGGLGQNALQRKKDQDYITVIDGASVSRPTGSGGSTLTTGILSAAIRFITSNTTDPAPDNDPIYVVLNGNQIHDIQTELAVVGTYPLPAGMSEETFRNGLRGEMRAFGALVYEDNHITADGSDDAKGGVHAKSGVICVQGFSLRTVRVRQEHIGGGAEDLLIYDQYAFGERAAGNRLVEIYTDAANPTT